MIPLLGTYCTLSNLKMIIMSQEELVKVYSDTEMTVTHLKKILDRSGIESLIKNDFESGISAGFVAGTTSSVELFVLVRDQKKAEAVIQQFIDELQK